MLVGIDEVGRGCWAGPLVAAAVVLPDRLSKHLAMLNDSKKLTRLQREKLVIAIRAEALAIGIGWVSARRIDVFGLTEAVRLAMREALNAITIPFDEVIIDGNYNFLDSPENTYAIRIMPSADALVPAVSAASIIAKVARDEHMVMAAKAFPEYGFEKHVGYGTAAHVAALKEYGVSELHRRSYKPVKALLE